MSDIILNTLPLIIPIHDTLADGLSAVSHRRIILIMYTQAITGPVTARVISSDHQDDTSLPRAPNSVATGGSQI